jgi:hypothetical protein
MKNGHLSIVSSVQGTGDSMTGPDPENGVCHQDCGSPVSSGLQVPMRQGMVKQEQDTLGDLPMAFFLQNVLQMHQQR